MPPICDFFKNIFLKQQMIKFVLERCNKERRLKETCSCGRRVH